MGKDLREMRDLVLWLHGKQYRIGNSQCKGPGVQLCLEDLKHSQEACGAGAE